MNITISMIKVLRSSGADQITLDTELPMGCWPYDGKAHLRMEVAAGTAEEYCAKNFPGVPVEVLDVRANRVVAS